MKKEKRFFENQKGVVTNAPITNKDLDPNGDEWGKKEKPYKWEFGCEAHCPKCGKEIPIMIIARLKKEEKLECGCGQIIVKT